MGGANLLNHMSLPIQLLGAAGLSLILSAILFVPVLFVPRWRYESIVIGASICTLVLGLAFSAAGMSVIFWKMIFNS